MYLCMYVYMHIAYNIVEKHVGQGPWTNYLSKIVQ